MKEVGGRICSYSPARPAGSDGSEFRGARGGSPADSPRGDGSVLRGGLLNRLTKRQIRDGASTEIGMAASSFFVIWPALRRRRREAAGEGDDAHSDSGGLCFVHLFCWFALCKRIGQFGDAWIGGE